MTLCLPRGYERRVPPAPFDDFAGASGVVYQPQVYALAGALAAQLGVSQVVDVGCGTGEKLLAMPVPTVGLDRPEIVARLRERHPERCWVDADLERVTRLSAPGSLVVCADVLEHLAQPENLLGALAVSGAVAIILSTPDREKVRGDDDLGPPANRHHAQEWTLAEFVELVQIAGLEVTRATWTQSRSDRPDQSTCLVECRP